MPALRNVSGDLIGGLLVTGIGAAFLFTSLSYDVGSLRTMGPGFFPAVMGGLTVALGLAITLGGVRRENPEVFGRLPLRAMLMIGGALVLFAITIDGLGFLLTTFLTGAVASLAATETTLKRVIATSAGLSAFTYVVFVLGLRLNLPLLGSWIS